jgi:23S rRNA (cytidine2498-2'-O)-methyltransferase
MQEKRVLEFVKPWVILTASADFVDLASSELQAVAVDPIDLVELSDEILLSKDVDFFVLAAAWQAAPPIFVRHICPAMVSLPLEADEQGLTALQRVVDQQLAQLIEPDFSFSVQTRLVGNPGFKPFDVNGALSRIIVQQTGAELDVRTPQQVLSVVIAPRVKSLDIADSESDSTAHSDLPFVAFLGVSLAAQNLSSWAGGMRRFRREPDRISRSEFKLLEAFEVFEVNLPARGVALDLGSSPGGWAHVLRQHEQYVTAVDPGELDPRIASDSGVRHKRMTAEKYLAREPDTFDIIVNDMRMDARDSARLMVDYAGQLYRHGIAIMTLKLPEYDRQAVIDKAFGILRRRYDITGVRQLFHNRSEITVLLKPLVGEKPRVAE